MMTCRGMTELIVLQLGLSLGIISNDLYVMLLVMALVTTSLTGPLLGWLLPTPTPCTRPNVALASNGSTVIASSEQSSGAYPAGSALLQRYQSRVEALPLGVELEPDPDGADVNFTWAIGSVPFHYSVRRDPAH